MTAENDKMVLPEDSLNRFRRSEAALAAMDISIHDYELPRYGFNIHDFGLLISPETLCEVMKIFEVYPIPNTKDWMHGLVNVRGNLVPVFDLPLLLGLSDLPMLHESLLVVDNGSESAGILIDGLPRPCDTRNWVKLSQAPSVPAPLADHITEAFTNDNLTWFGFNHREFFKNLRSSVAN